MTLGVVPRLAVMAFVSRVQVHNLGMVAAGTLEAQAREVVHGLTGACPIGGLGLVLMPAETATQIPHDPLLSGRAIGAFDVPMTLRSIGARCQSPGHPAHAV